MKQNSASLAKVDLRISGIHQQIVVEADRDAFAGEALLASSLADDDGRSGRFKTRPLASQIYLGPCLFVTEQLQGLTQRFLFHSFLLHLLRNSKPSISKQCESSAPSGL